MTNLNQLLDRYDQLGRRYVVSADIGQAHDPTAVAVLEIISTSKNAGALREAMKVERRFNLVHLERLPLNLSYVAQVGYIAELMGRDPLSSPKTRLVIDATGVGRAVFDLFKRGGLKPEGVTITGGEGESYVDSMHRVAKVQLVSTLQAALHAGELKIAAGLKDGKALVNELREFRVSYSSAGNALFAAREGQHDDLCLALALGVWFARRGRTVETERLDFEKLRVRF